ncbi:hypothetical protein F5Y08DRAFT_348991 [Xylaria arbuscula]|nr:hypothetical protein F5Y08DRAFT_348991 [Xylaria arbuscula]
MNGHEDCRLGPNAGRKVELTDIGKYMMEWCESMHESSSDDKVKFLQHLDRSLSQYFTSTFGIPDRNWVFFHTQESCRSEKVKFLQHDASTTDLACANYSRDYGGETWGAGSTIDFETNDRTLDFVSFAFKWGSDELLFHYLENGFSLTESYKDYLLLFSLRPRTVKPPRGWIEKLLKDGANPNAMFYWGLHDRVKTSPWLTYLLDNPSFWICDYELWSNFNVDTVKLFLDQGARLDDRTILIYAVEHSTVGSYWDEHEVIEQFAEASPEDSERILDNLNGGNDLIPYLEEHMLDDGSDNGSDEDLENQSSDNGSDEDLENLSSNNGSNEDLENLSMILQVWEASPKIPSIRQYLEERGYYKPPNDPAVIQSPIPMFEDNTISDSRDFAATN